MLIARVHAAKYFGRARYQMMHDPPVTEYTYQIDLEWRTCTTLMITAHAVVKCGCIEETAWGNCGGEWAQFPGNNWATYFTYHVQ